MEKRKKSKSKPSLLPLDYLKMVSEVFTTNFDAGLAIYGKFAPDSRFEAKGEILAEEIVLAVSLTTGNGKLSANSVYASVDFDPKASAPSVQELLSACVDAIGSVFGGLLSPENPEGIESLANSSLSSLENIPYEWTQVEADKKKVFIKMDKANLQLDEIADAWLMKNDPDLIEHDSQVQKETEKLFITGPSSKKPTGSGSGFTH